MILRPPRSILTYTPFPYTALFLSARLLTRSKLNVIISDVLKLQEEILRRAEEHADTVMPGYTHLQHAEPITLGLFLLAFHDVLTRSEEHTSELQSLMRISYAVFCLKKHNNKKN